LIDVFQRDLRFGLRQLRRSPTFSAISIAALAIGVGVNITVFSLVNGWLFRPLDAVDPAQLVRITGPGGNTNAVLWTDNEVHISAADYDAYRDRNETFSSIGASQVGGPTRVRWNGPTEMIPVTPVTGNYFEMLGVRAAMGRTVTPEDTLARAREVVVLSDVGWRRHFDAAPDIVGQTVVVDGIPHLVAGVLPPWFTGTTAPMVPQIYRPMFERAGRLAFPDGVPTGFRRLQLIGRLKAGVTAEQGRADLRRIATQLTAEDRQTRAIELYPARSTMPFMYRALMAVSGMFGLIVAVVLLITCDNIAILTAIRTAVRSPEIGVRLALGASRGRIVFQLVLETALLCAVGGVIGTFAAFAAARFSTQFYLPVPMPFALTFKPDWRVIAFAVLVSFTALMLCGLMPALKTLRTDLVGIIKGDGLKTSVQSGLVTTQLTLSTALLVVAAVLAHSATANTNLARGFVSDGVVMSTIALNGAEYTAERRLALLQRLLENVERTPGVAAAAVVANVPVANNAPMPPLEVRSNGRIHRVQVNTASPRLFRTLSTPLLSGRDFQVLDDAQPASVGIVNEALGQAFWPNVNPIGQTLVTGDGQAVQVVGLVRNIAFGDVFDAAPPVLYRPLRHAVTTSPTVLLKTVGDPSSFVTLVRTRLAELDSEAAAYNVMRLDDRLNLGRVVNRAAATAGGVLGLLALALGSFGIYGTMASLAQRRHREIGIRMALGASRREIVRIISMAGLRWSAVGVGLGLGLGALALFGLSRMMRGVSASDPLAFAVTAVLLLIVSGTACYIPARRASRLSVTASLRES
jgi:predicted permease